VKQYAELAPTITSAIELYATEVRAGTFPDERHTYSITDEELAIFDDALAEVRSG
jgi:3-methyl-2-oxobutanoate hydroxymethyltransferase